MIEDQSLLKLDSKQEAIVERLMQRSFGAQKLFIPKKFTKHGGGALWQPADIAWVDKDFVALFYLKDRKNKSLQKQIEGNKKQATGYHRMWKTEDLRYALRGENRFGDQCEVAYESLTLLVNILVVSQPCGIQLSPPITISKQNLVLVIPDTLIHMISTYGGTIVDLFCIAKLFFALNLDHSTPNIEAFEILQQLTQDYIHKAISSADSKHEFFSGKAENDYQFIFEHIARMRAPGGSDKAMAEREQREIISELFCDFTLEEYALVAATAEKAIVFSEPPNFKKWVVCKVRGEHYSFVIHTINMHTPQKKDSIREAVKASKNTEGITDCVLIQYANIYNINDYRVPSMVALPEIEKKHAVLLIEHLLKLNS